MGLGMKLENQRMATRRDKVGPEMAERDDM